LRHSGAEDGGNAVTMVVILHIVGMKAQHHLHMRKVVFIAHLFASLQDDNQEAIKDALQIT
jgi:hypothetical protein